MTERSEVSKRVRKKNGIKSHIPVKIGVVGESQVGKTSLMVKYIENKYDEEYIETLGVNFMEKTIQLRRAAVTLSVWNLGGQTEYIDMIPLVCHDARVILFVFDLTCKRSLTMIRQWYNSVRKIYKCAIPFLIGAKFDLYVKKDQKFQQEITSQARKFSKSMKAPLIYCSSSHGINIKTIFQLVLAYVFNLQPKVQEVKKLSEPIVQYMAVLAKRAMNTKKRSSGSSSEKKSESKDLVTSIVV